MSHSDQNETVASSEAVVAAFLPAKRTQPNVEIGNFLPHVTSTEYRTTLQALLLADLPDRLCTSGWRVEEYFCRFPEVANDPTWVCEVAAREYQLRCAGGEQVELQEYQRRFPHIRNQRRDIFGSAEIEKDTCQLSGSSRQERSSTTTKSKA